MLHVCLSRNYVNKDVTVNAEVRSWHAKWRKPQKPLQADVALLPLLKCIHMRSSCARRACNHPPLSFVFVWLTQLPLQASDLTPRTIAVLSVGINEGSMQNDFSKYGHRVMGIRLGGH